MKKNFPRSGIYAVITENFCLNGSAVKTLAAVLKGGVSVVQMREKDACDEVLVTLGRKFRKLTKRYKIPFIMNDRPDIASLVKADGVHLGQEDIGISEVKRKYPELIIGVSTHNLKEALSAQNSGADYINIGPVFPTKTKDTGKYKPLGIDGIKEIVPKIKIPFSIMGGIKAHNIPDVRKAGARLFAMVTEITMSDDINNKIKILKGIITRKQG